MDYNELKFYLRGCADCEIIKCVSSMNVHDIVYAHTKQYKENPIGFGLCKENNSFCIYDLNPISLKNEIPLEDLIHLEVNPEKVLITRKETKIVFKYNEELYSNTTRNYRCL